MTKGKQEEIEVAYAAYCTYRARNLFCAIVTFFILLSLLIDGIEGFEKITIFSWQFKIFLFVIGCLVAYGTYWSDEKMKDFKSKHSDTPN